MSVAEKVKIELWTPAKAKAALETMRHNRKVRPVKVTQYARDMMEGRWTFCPDPITFDDNGELINGQHRLEAQIAADMKISWIVVRDVDDNVQETMDTGASRSLADALDLEKHTNTRTLGATLRLCLQMEKGRIYNQVRDRNASIVELTEFLGKHPEIERSVELAVHVNNTGILKTRPSVLAAAHWWIAKHTNQADADEFLYRLGRMTGEPEGSPVIALVKRLNEVTRTKMRIESRWLIFMVIKAWNYHAVGETLVKINLMTRDGEYRLPIPEPMGSTRTHGTDPDDD
jgi:hypothetical protein